MRVIHCAGAPPLPNFGYTLHGTKGTLHLDVANGKLQLALASEGGVYKEVDIAPAKRAGWRVEEEVGTTLISAR